MFFSQCPRLLRGGRSKGTQWLLQGEVTEKSRVSYFSVSSETSCMELETLGDQRQWWVAGEMNDINIMSSYLKRCMECGGRKGTIRLDT
mmetsp:Transcript_22932/g.48534  ORF Transcript_22932/g.48534 Transcript_22932/m.48534 type:complete len:89 (-) Transcript_22932:211-477(-)